MKKSIAPRAAAQGFTLIEILIVMLIISIVGGVAMLSISVNQTTRYKNLAQQITALLALGEEQALLQDAVYGLGFSAKAFQYYQFDVNKTPHWQPLTDKVMGKRTIPDGVQISVQVQGKLLPLLKDETNNDSDNVDLNKDAFAGVKPQIIFATNGDILPFTILIGKTGSLPRYQITGNANGSIESAALN